MNILTLYCDFETTSYHQYLKEGKTRVYLGGFADNFSNTINYFFSIEEFINIIKKYSEEFEYINIYFHNLAFDLSFILYYLNELGYTHKCRKQGEYELDEKEYDIFINLQGQVYSCEMIINSSHITFRDSLKKLPTTIKNLGNIVGTQKLDETHNYEEEKPIYTHISQVPEEELFYLQNDILILKKAIEIFEKDIHFKYSLTSSSLSYNSWLCDYFNYKINPKRSYFRQIKELKERLQEILPVVEDEDIQNIISRSYRGGITYLNPKYKGVEVSGCSYDVNSLYPFSMINRAYPCGQPKFVEKYDTNELQIITFATFECEVKDSIPFIPTKQKGKSYEYSSVLHTGIYSLWNEEYELFKQYYNVNPTIISIVQFDKIYNLFDNYINKLAKVKSETKDKGIRYMTKLRLNGLGGKFGTKPLQVKKICLGNTNERGGLKFGIFVEEQGEIFYKAISSYMTSQARITELKGIIANYNRFIYCDTDSLYIVGYTPATGIKIHDSELGAFKREHTFQKGKFLHTKCYLIQDGEELIHSIAGCNQSAKALINFNNFEDNLSLPNANLKALQVKGGVVLKPVDFTIKER